MQPELFLSTLEPVTGVIQKEYIYKISRPKSLNPTPQTRCEIFDEKQLELFLSTLAPITGVFQKVYIYKTSQPKTPTPTPHTRYKIIDSSTCPCVEVIPG